jgi:HD-GYP domain-containing protein (c-di-GMP phosphodiesterase class II)
MRRVSVAALEAGMVLARPVLDLQGRILAKAGTAVSPALIARAAGFGIQALYVEDPRFAGIDLSDEVPQAVVAGVIDLFGRLAKAYDAATPPRLDPTEVDRLVDGITESVDPAQPLSLLRPRDEATYLPIQAVNGARLALAAAAAAGQGMRARDAATAALLRDVGMLAVPEAVRRRPGPLTAEETAAVREHVARSLELASHPYWNPFVKVAMSRHHERLDGSGYPAGLAGDDVHPLGALLGAVDCYCALVAPRPHRPAYRPEEALEMLLGLADWQLSAPAVRAVAGCVGLYPRGAVVRLSTGDEAVVTHPGRGTYERPRVRLLGDGSELDLRAREHLHTQIAAVVDA